MGKQRVIEFIVGVFIIIAIVCFVFLAFKVSGLTSYSHANAYMIYADFEDIGDLKERAPVTIAGVRVGQVTKVTLENNTYQARVTMRIDSQDHIPVDSTANIYTAGLIGSNYISLTPGFSEDMLKEGGQITRTNQALILQNVIGQLLFTLKNDGSKSEDASETPAETPNKNAPLEGNS